MAKKISDENNIFIALPIVNEPDFSVLCCYKIIHIQIIIQNSVNLE